MAFLPPRNSGAQRAPPWSSSMEAAAPPAWMASAMATRPGRAPGSLMPICWGWERPVSRSTITSPTVTRAAPPAAFRR